VTPSVATRGGLRRPWVAALLVLVFALAVRVGAFELAPPERIVGDEGYYAEVALHLAEGRGHGQDGIVHARWPPAFPFVLSWFTDPALAAERPYPTTWVRRLMRVQIVIGALVAVAIWALARELFDARVALVAGGLAAAYPTFVAYSHYLWSEPLFLLLATTGLALAVRAHRRRALGTSVLAGVAFGLATLTREVGLPIAGAVLVWQFATAARGERARALARGTTMVACAVLVVLPWTWRNWRLYERVVPVSSVAWMGIREGNTLQPDWMQPNSKELNAFRQQYFSFGDEMERVDFARAQSIELIRREQPWWAFKKLVRTTALLFTPDSFLFKKVSRGSYGDVALGPFRAVLIATILSYLAVMSLGTLGALAARVDGRRRLLFLLVFAVVFALQAIAQAKSRYRLPVMPLFVVHAAYALVAGPSLWSGLSRASKLAVVAALLVLFGFCVPTFWSDAVQLFETATYVDPRRP